MYPSGSIRAMELSLWLAQQRGRAKALAAHLDVPSSFVSKMANREKPVPVVHGIPIEEFTQGEVRRVELFPREIWIKVWPDLSAHTGVPNDLHQIPCATEPTPALQPEGA